MDYLFEVIGVSEQGASFEEFGKLLELLHLYVAFKRMDPEGKGLDKAHVLELVKSITEDKNGGKKRNVVQRKMVGSWGQPLGMPAGG